MTRLAAQSNDIEHAFVAHANKELKITTRTNSGRNHWKILINAVDKDTIPNILPHRTADLFERGELRGPFLELLREIDKSLPWANRPMSWFSEPDEWIQPLLREIGFVPDETSPMDDRQATVACC